MNIVSPDDQRFRWIGGLFWQCYNSDFPGSRDAGLGYDYDDDDFQDLGVPYDRDEYNYAVFASSMPGSANRSRYKRRPRRTLDRE